MKLQDLLEELTPSQYRKYVKGWDKSRYKEIFQRYTDDPKAFRIFLPFKGAVKKSITIPEIVETILAGMGYVVTSDSYEVGLACKRFDFSKSFKIGKLIQDIINRGSTEKNTENLEYMNHSALEWAGEDESPNSKGDHQRKGNVKKFAEMALQKFTNDPQRSASKSEDFFIVISRHPYDIAGMSTNRGWKSCMNLKGGMYQHYVALDVQNGTLVAYLVKNDDKNINHPVGRVLIKPFISIDDPDLVAFGVENDVYGTDVSGFREQVTKWADEVNDSKKLDGLFVFHPKLYDDAISSYKNFSKDPIVNGDQVVYEVDDLNDYPGAKVIKVNGKRGLLGTVGGITGGNSPTDGKYCVVAISSPDHTWKLRMKYVDMHRNVLKKIKDEK